MLVIGAIFLGAAFVFHRKAAEHARNKSSGAIVKGSPSRLISVLCGISAFGIIAHALFGK